MLLWDGAADGGTRGGYWTECAQGVRVCRDRPLQARHAHGRGVLPRQGRDCRSPTRDSKLWGVNYEYAIGEDTTLGATYMKWSADPTVAPQRDGLDVYNVRAFTAPFPSFKALSFEVEYALEDNGDALDSTAWNVLVAYQLDMAWQPKLSYRYAFFEGDDPATAENEAFDALFTGFYDWGTWWQGEIAGEYFVSNSNLISHQLRVHAKPNEAISTGLIFFDFVARQPARRPGVTSDDVAIELDWYMDWSINDNFTA